MLTTTAQNHFDAEHYGARIGLRNGFGKIAVGEWLLD